MNILDQSALTEEENDNKFYSLSAITLATFLGGPLVAGLLIWQNYRNRGEHNLAITALLTGFFSTILLLAGILSLPETILAKIPKMLIPIVFCAIVYIIAQKTQGSFLTAHREKKRPFYSIWRAVGIGSIFFLIAFVLGFISMVSLPDNFDILVYDQKLAEFRKNEEKALELFEILETKNLAKAKIFIRDPGISCWLKNLQIVVELDKMEGLPPDYKEQNELLREYCQLRIQTYQLIEKMIDGKTTSLDRQIQDLEEMIENVLEEMKNR